MQKNRIQWPHSWRNHMGDADTKVKSLIYFSLAAQGQKIYHQRFPHSVIDQIFAFELAHEISLSFTRPRNTTYDRYLLFTCKQKENEKLKRFYYRLKAMGAKCRLGTAEDDLIKILIAFMSYNADIQRELLMETRTPLQILQFALNRERGQESQRAINTQLNRLPLFLPNQISFIQRNQTPSQNPRQRTPNWNLNNNAKNPSISNPCRRCGVQFTQEHLLVCPAKKIQYNLCKKAGHYGKVCHSAKFL